ncbi:hypothetical protein ACFC1L_44390, partial [Streptomyces sp. NPDC056210]|uniref:hypothetical protein n=1 Tax=Streptomyces sp. NPDC056210 TaxID=3345746 RepID=UPI0035E1BD5F
MSAPMDDQRLDEILDRANTATKGPWCTDSWEIYQGAEYVPGISFWIGETCRGTSDLEQDRADAEFVAAARTDVPELVAEVQRLRAERHSTNEALDDAVEQLRVQRDRIAELETRGSRARTDELVPGDRVWHPYEMACFTVTRVAPDGSASGLLFHNRATDGNESG